MYWVHVYMFLCTCGCELSHFSGVLFFATLWTVAHQVPLSLEFPKQEYWSGLPCPPPGNLPHPGIQSGSPAFSCISRWILYQGATWEPKNFKIIGRTNWTESNCLNKKCKNIRYVEPGLVFILKLMLDDLVVRPVLWWVEFTVCATYKRNPPS